MKDYATRQGTNFSVYFPPDEFDDLMALVTMLDKPRASVIRDAVKRHVERERKRHARKNGDA